MPWTRTWPSIRKSNLLFRKRCAKWSTKKSIQKHPRAKWRNSVTLSSSFWSMLKISAKRILHRRWSSTQRSACWVGTGYTDSNNYHGLAVIRATSWMISMASTQCNHQCFLQQSTFQAGCSWSSRLSSVDLSPVKKNTLTLPWKTSSSCMIRYSQLSRSTSMHLACASYRSGDSTYSAMILAFLVL